MSNLIWSLDRKPKGIDGEDSLASSLTRAVGGLIDKQPDLVKTITKTLSAGEPLDYAFVNTEPKLVRTFIGGDIDQPHYSNRRPKIMAYSLHPDGTLCIGEPVAMQARTGEEDPELVLVPKEDNDGKAFTGRWSEQDGRLTLVWNNRSRTYEFNMHQNVREQLVVFHNISGSSRQPFILREYTPLVWFKGDPGAPMVIEEVQEESADSPMTVPVVDPVVTDPQPTVTDTPIPTQLFGLTANSGQSGGPLGNTKGNEDFGAKIFGNGRKANKIVYLIDASGSMVDVLPFVVKEVKRSVGQLHVKQNATVLIFSGRGIYEVPGGGGIKGLRSANPKFKQEIEEWLSLENHNYETGGAGSKHAEAAIMRALSYEPQIIFLLSDNLIGGGQGATQHEISQEEIMKAIHKANNAEQPAKFYTLHFLYPDPLVRAGLQGTLQRLAEETGGNYKFISGEDLNLK